MTSDTTDLQACFDRVNQDRLMARLKTRCPDADLLRLTNHFLKAGVSIEGQYIPRLSACRKVARSRLC